MEISLNPGVSGGFYVAGESGAVDEVVGEDDHGDWGVGRVMVDRISVEELTTIADS